jgi:prepilin-type N-terminal cleavage/methylation domain-containing protein
MTRRRNGFTLIELMVVLVLLAVTAAAAVPAFLGDSASSPERRVATALSDVLVRTRDAARESGASSALVLAPADGRYWLTTRDSVLSGVLPLAQEGVRIGEGRGAERVECHFQPAGPATPCSIAVHGTRSLIVRVDGWSGEIRVDDDHAR